MKGRKFVELEKESQYLNANLEKLMQSIGIQDKTTRSVGRDETGYKEKHHLQKAPDYEKKVRWTLDLIKKLQKYEIGNPQKISMIKKSLEENRPVDKNDIEYLKEKFYMLQKIS